MRVLAICEDAPDDSAETGQGSTLITARVLPQIARDIAVDLAWFNGRGAELPAELRDSCAGLTCLPLRSARASWLASSTTRLPRATWRRTSPAALRATAAGWRRADVVYVHGLHAFGLAMVLHRRWPRPMVVQEVDPWSEHWRQRGAQGSLLQRVYDGQQAQRAVRLERAAAACASRYLLVSPTDAEHLGSALGRRVLAIPNGVLGEAIKGPRCRPAPATVGFFGTLDYVPNLVALRVLCEEVLPDLVRHVPEVRVWVGGRRPRSDVMALQTHRVQILGEVSSPAGFYQSVAVMAFPGTLGTGTKNTLLEALNAGAAVVASRSAARSVPAVGQMVVVDTPGEMAQVLASLLRDEPRRLALAEQAARWGATVPSWSSCAQDYAQVLREVRGEAWLSTGSEPPRRGTV